MKKEDFRNNPDFICAHKPSETQSKIIKLKHWNCDIATAKCSTCGALLQIPQAYYSLPVKIIYLLVAAISSWINFSAVYRLFLKFSLPPIVLTLLFLLLELGVLILADCIIFTFVSFGHRWQPIKADPEKVLMVCSIANSRYRTERKHIFRIANLGSVSTLALTVGLPITPLVFIEVLYILFCACRRKRIFTIVMSSILLVVIALALWAHITFQDFVWINYISAIALIALAFWDYRNTIQMQTLDFLF